MPYMNYQNALAAGNDYARRAGIGLDAAGRFNLSGAGALGASPQATDKTREYMGQHAANIADAANKVAAQNNMRANAESAWQAAHERNLQASEQMRRNQETMGQQQVAAQRNNVLAGLLTRMSPAGGPMTTTVSNYGQGW